MITFTVGASRRWFAVEDDEGSRRLGPTADELDELLTADVRPLRAADVLGVDEGYGLHGVTRSWSTSGRW
jgi:hypothetical protein